MKWQHTKAQTVKINKLIFWTSLIFLVIWGIGFTIGQFLPVEISDRELQRKFYAVGFYGLPISVAIFMFSFIKRDESIGKILGKIAGGLFLSFGVYSILMRFVIVLGFGAWKDAMVLFQNPNNEKHKIVEQIFDEGAMGYGGTRVVETKPILIFFKTVIPIEVEEVDETIWERKDEYVLFKE